MDVKSFHLLTFVSLSIDYKDCRGGDDCCNESNKCEEDEGDCDSDQDCKDGLICGSKNCNYDSGFEWDSSDDCCTKLKGKKYFIISSMKVIKTILISYLFEHYAYNQSFYAFS